MWQRTLAIMCGVVCLLFEVAWAQQQVVSYNIVYVRAPRHSTTVPSRMPEVKHPVHTEPGTNLMLRPVKLTTNPLKRIALTPSLLPPHLNFTRR